MKEITLFIGLLLALPVFGETFNTPSSIPKNLHIYSTGGSTYVDLVGHSCSGSRYYIKSDHVRYDEIFSILLAAQMAQQEVILRVSGCNSNNQGEIIGVYLRYGS